MASTHPLNDEKVNDWLTQGIEVRPTEIFLPVTMEVAPVWCHQTHRGGFFARLSVLFAGDGALILDDLECDHIHDTREDAWPCAYALAMKTAEEALAAKGPQ